MENKNIDWGDPKGDKTVRKYECVVCKTIVESDDDKNFDYHQFNSCKECWKNKRDAVMKKRFPLMNTFIDALKIDKLTRIKMEFTPENQWIIDVDDVLWLIEQAERYEKLRVKWNKQVDDENQIINERNELVADRDYWKQKCLLLQRQ